MTTPSERSRALRFAYEFMQEIQQDKTLPEAHRRSAAVTLRHYPTPAEVAWHAAMPGYSNWIGPEIPERRYSEEEGQEEIQHRDVWTVWLEQKCEDQAVRRYAMIGYARTELGARALFASRFGPVFGGIAQSSPGVVVNEITSALFSPAIIQMAVQAACRQWVFSVFAGADTE